jgi:hypothetical protein
MTGRALFARTGGVAPVAATPAHSMWQGFAGARGIRRGFRLANSAGTYEFARRNPATSRAPAASRPVEARAGRAGPLSERVSSGGASEGCPPGRARLARATAAAGMRRMAARPEGTP